MNAYFWVVVGLFVVVEDPFIAHGWSGEVVIPVRGWFRAHWDTPLVYRTGLSSVVSGKDNYELAAAQIVAQLLGDFGGVGLTDAGAVAVEHRQAAVMVQSWMRMGSLRVPAACAGGAELCVSSAGDVEKKKSL